ncbi:MAG: preprotein translocase subunit YajC [Verrucomicrobiales bacterium]|nr:MAG: preprotein translocase subunit YajC [Verrucomicrobiales bacterium]
MDSNTWHSILAQSGQQPQGWTQMIMFIPIILMVVFLMFSQNKKAKQHAKLLTTLKSGDKVLTTSGIIGTVVSVREKEKIITIRSADAKLELTLSAVADITERGTQKSDS